MKIAAGIEYCGLSYSGWQRQKHAQSVQQFVEQALSVVADQEITVQCAGRTDTGVHALQQVIHFETEVERKPYSWMMGANANLPDDIGLLWVKEVDDAFHARFSATARSYRYIILNRQSKPALHHGYVSWCYRNLNVELMAEAASYLLGRHDFTSYRTQRCQAKSPVRDVKLLKVEHLGKYIIISIQANAFLHHMVRNIAGVLMEIGQGDRPPIWAKEVLEARKREVGGITASPHGLYLVDIDYPVEFGLPKPVKPDWPIPEIVKDKM